MSEAQEALCRLDEQVVARPFGTALLGAMRTREARASSQIEDTVASGEDLALASLDERGVASPALDVLRNRLAIEHGLSSALPVSGRLVREMHAELIREARLTPGAYRRGEVCIGDDRRGFSAARFVPPPASRVEALMGRWEAFCNGATVPLSEGEPGLVIPALVRLALAHYQFETIHPFMDGNGRLGRALVTLAPVKEGWLKRPVCNLSEWVQGRRQEYYDRLLRVSTHGDWEGWVRFIVTALAEQARMDGERAARLIALYERYKGLLTKAKVKMTVLPLLDHLFERQAVTVTIAARVMGLTYNAAAVYVERLSKLGIVQPVAGVRHGRPYVARGVIGAIDGEG
jgi:Fic family protein